MGRIEKTVFISYRRTNFWTALAIYQDLTAHGFDVFFDYQSIDSGDFEQVIVENIKYRAHFIVILSPSALERCSESDDWLRREIELAIGEKRNIVPVMMEGFDFDSPLSAQALTGKLSLLRKYNAMRIYSEYFDAAMDKLRQRCLNIALSDVALQPLSNIAKELTESQKKIADNEILVGPAKLLEQESLETEYLNKLMRIPIVGRIVASEPVLIPRSDFNYYDAEMSVLVGESLIPISYARKNLFALEVDGDSMIDAMVNDGDIVILKAISKDEKVRNGEMVAVWLSARDESTLKYFYEEDKCYRLQPANPTMGPIIISKDEPIEIKGKVVMIIRKVDMTEL